MMMIILLVHGDVNLGNVYNSLNPNLKRRRREVIIIISA